jgi:hypothetical protein
MKPYFKLLIVFLLKITCVYGQNQLDSSGRKQGYWCHKRYDLKSECGVYENDIRHGLWCRYSSRGIVTDSGVYQNNQRIGKWFIRKDIGDAVGPFIEVDYTDSGITVWRNPPIHYFINRDSTHLVLYSSNQSNFYKQIECKCIDSLSIDYECFRYRSNGKLYQRTVFSGFEQTFIWWESKWYKLLPIDRSHKRNSRKK